MQKSFYYKLLKRLGIFPNATFSDSGETIDFGSGDAVSSINTFSGDVTVSADSTKGVQLTSFENDISLQGSANYLFVSGGSTGLLGGTFYNPNVFTAGGVNSDPSATATKNLGRVYTPPLPVEFYRVKVILDVAPGTGESVTVKAYMNGVDRGSICTFTDSNANIGTYFSLTINAGDLLCFNVTKSAGAASTAIVWNMSLYFYDPLYP
jgi:hypothetical protein